MGKRINWEQVSEIAEKIKAQGLSLAEGAGEFGIPVRRLYEISRRNKKAGDAGNLESEETVGAAQKADAQATATEGENSAGDNETARFEQSPLPEELQRLIIRYRTENPDAGFKRIEDRLKGEHLVVVSRKQIRHVLKIHDLLKGHDSSFDRPDKAAKGTRRFEASYAGEMYQMDVTYVYLTGIPVLYLVVIIDDHSRFCVAAELCHDQKGESLIGVLHNCCIRHGNPRKLLTDQGSGFYSWSAQQTLFQQYLDEQKIEHIVSNPHSPQSQGKVERLNQTIKRECLGRVHFKSYSEAVQGIADYIRGYNFGRPHQGIGGFRPADRFHGVIGERSRIEAELVGKEIDFSKGYCIFKVQDHCVSVVSSEEGIEVFLDGKLLQEVADERLH
ncbi:MAG: transposase [Deltaproteobacteria bacterium]|nr:transposase [Deltaproteobacteria bacterium]